MASSRPASKKTAKGAAKTPSAASRRPADSAGYLSTSELAVQAALYDRVARGYGQLTLLIDLTAPDPGFARIKAIATLLGGAGPLEPQLTLELTTELLHSIQTNPTTICKSPFDPPPPPPNVQARAAKKNATRTPKK